MNRISNYKKHAKKPAPQISDTQLSIIIEGLIALSLISHELKSRES